jgi:hypothetical protein
MRLQAQACARQKGAQHTFRIPDLRHLPDEPGRDRVVKAIVCPKQTTPKSDLGGSGDC